MSSLSALAMWPGYQEMGLAVPPSGPVLVLPCVLLVLVLVLVKCAVPKARVMALVEGMKCGLNSGAAFHSCARHVLLLLELIIPTKLRCMYARLYVRVEGSDGSSRRELLTI